MANPTAAMLVIGDEILSGRTHDTNSNFLAQELTKHGIAMKEIRVVSDHQPAIVAGLNALREAYDNVFTSGGIGPTHDDITADAIAAAFGVPIGIRQDAYDILAEHYAAAGAVFNEPRQRMARIPEGATLIENPISAAPGFSIGNVHVMAGVPNVFQAMVASVIPTLTGGDPVLSQTLRVNHGEGEIAEALGELARDFSELSIGCYPFAHEGIYGANIVIRGTDAGQIDRAMARLASLYPEGAG